MIEKFLFDSGTDILGLCETFLDEISANKIDVKDYQFFHRNRTQQKQGGLAVLIKNYIPARMRDDFLQFNIEMNFECCVVECFLPNNEKLLIVVIYRPPSSSKVNFISRLENMLVYLSSLRIPFMILGDFNIDLMRCLPSDHHGIDNYALQFLECSLSCNLYPACFVPSRVADSSTSLIDNILSPYTCEATSVIMDESSDHCMIMSDYKIQKTLIREIITRKRNLSLKNIHNLKVALGDVDWSEVLEERDPNRSLDIFYRD